jgi:hypothetical protein
LKFYKNTTMKARASFGSTRIGFKDLMLLLTFHKEELRVKDDFSTYFPHVFHNEKIRFDNNFGKFSTKKRFPILFFNR